MKYLSDIGWVSGTKPLTRKMRDICWTPQGSDPSAITGLQFWFRPDTAFLTTVTYSGMTVVTDWSSRIGALRPLAQSTSNNKPAYISSAINGQPAILFDGIDDYLLCDTAIWGTAIPQPLTVYIILQLVTVGASKSVFDGAASLTRVRFLTNTSTNWQSFAGTTLGSLTTANTSWHKFRLTFNGASSIIRLDAVNIKTGDAGTNPMGGTISLGAGQNGASIWANIQVADWFAYNKILSTAEIALLESYFLKRYAL